MPIRTIETVANVEADRRLILQLPLDVPVGRHRVVAVIDEITEDLTPNAGAWTFPVVANAQWPADMPLTRAEMYDDDGR
jgi:hypothetical protein